MSDELESAGNAEPQEGAHNAQNSEAPPDASPISGVAPPKDTRWRKGVSGNPGGRPKGRGVTHYLREILAREHNGRPIGELVAERLVKDALSGKFAAAKEIMERTDGKVPDKHQIEGKTEQTVFVCPPPRVLGRGAKPAALPAEGEPADGQ